MGKAGKSRRHAAKMRAKMAAKRAKRVAYAALAGTSSKRKKMYRRGRSQAFSPHKRLHLITNCGNVGCAKCHPEFAMPRWGGRLWPVGTQLPIGS